MKILSEEIKIKKPASLSSEYIENELKKTGRDPLRWAIVDVHEETLVVSVSYYK